ncbi:MAG: hypothetical protein DME11_23285, partial [Candidatus Rokuibacteriota bacterium]
TGTDGTIELQDDTLVVTRAGNGTSRWPCPPALSGGGYHPDWFDAVAEQFLAEVAGQGPRGANLDEASLCVALERSARASSLAGGRGVALGEVSG